MPRAGGLWRRRLQDKTAVLKSHRVTAFAQSASAGRQGVSGTFRCPNKIPRLPNWGRIPTQFAFERRARVGAQHRSFHVRPLALLRDGFYSRCRYPDFACVFEPLNRLVQPRPERGCHACSRPRRACSDSSPRGVCAATRQVDGARPALGLSSQWSPEMLVPGQRGDGFGEEADPSPFREAACCRS